MGSATSGSPDAAREGQDVVADTSARRCRLCPPGPYEARLARLPRIREGHSMVGLSGSSLRAWEIHRPTRSAVTRDEWDWESLLAWAEQQLETADYEQ